MACNFRRLLRADKHCHEKRVPCLPEVALPAMIHGIAPPYPDHRTIIIGDVHGCFDELELLLAKCNWTTTDRLVFIGDLMSKGPKPIEVLRFVQKSGALCIRGNHDDGALRALHRLRSSEDNLATNEKEKLNVIAQQYAYTEEFTQEDIAFLQDLPFSIQFPEFNAIAVHAGLVPGILLENQLPNDMYRMRNVVERQQNGGKQWEAVERIDTGVPWAQQWNGPQHVYFGHDAKRGIQDYEYCTGLDTGCVYGKQLSAIVLPSKEVVQIDALKMHCEPKDKS